MFSTIPENEYEDAIDSALYHLEIVIVIWFGSEFIVRYVDGYLYIYIYIYICIYIAVFFNLSVCIAIVVLYQ